MISRSTKHPHVVDRFVLDGPDRLEPQGRLPAQGGVVGGDDLKLARVGLADEGDAPRPQAAHALGCVELRMNLADEPISPDRSVLEQDDLSALDPLRRLGVDPQVVRPRAHLDGHGIRVGGDRLGPRLRAGLVGGSVEYRVGPDGKRVGAGRQPLGDSQAEPHTGGVGGVGGNPIAQVRGTADSAERPGRPSSHGQAPVEPGHRQRCPATPPSGSAWRSCGRAPRARPPRRSGRSGGQRRPLHSAPPARPRRLPGQFGPSE